MRVLGFFMFSSLKLRVDLQVAPTFSLRLSGVLKGRALFGEFGHAIKSYKKFTVYPGFCLLLAGFSQFAVPALKNGS